MLGRGEFGKKALIEKFAIGKLKASLKEGLAKRSRNGTYRSPGSGANSITSREETPIRTITAYR